MPLRHLRHETACRVRNVGATAASERDVPRVAVTGGIGCGKSALGRLLAERGADVVDADDIVHQLQQPGQTLSIALSREFGPAFLLPNGAVDRSALAAHVFHSPAHLARLNAISHPAVRSWLHGWLETRTPSWAKVAIIPLLFESGWESDWDLTVCVTCSPNVQRERLRLRGWSDEDAQRRLAAQWPLSQKVERADIVIDNDTELTELAAAADALRQTILEMYR